MASCRFLQSDQSPLWVNNGVLFSSVMSRNESHWWVRGNERDSFTAHCKHLDLSTCGKIRKTIDAQRRCQLLNISSTSWFGFREILTMNRFFQAELVSFDLFCLCCYWLTGAIGVAFPKAFTALVRQIFKRLYRVFSHIYCHHYPVIIQLGLEPHLNTSFKHYVLFIDEHNLTSGKDFWGPLGDLVDNMLKSSWRTIEWHYFWSELYKYYFF